MSHLKSLVIGFGSFILYRIVYEVLALDAKIETWATEIRNVV